VGDYDSVNKLQKQPAAGDKGRQGLNDVPLPELGAKGFKGRFSSGPGKNNNAGPRPKQTAALMIIKVLNFILPSLYIVQIRMTI